MRIRKILLEIQRECSHIVECPRFEVAVRRAVNPPDTKFRIHSRLPKDCTDANYATYDSWKDAWAELRSKFGALVQEVYDPVTFQDEFDATVERDGDGVAPEASEVIHDNWEPLVDIDGVGEDLAKKLFEAGFQSINAVAGASLDDLEAIDGIGASSSKRIRDHARELVNFVPDAGEAAPAESESLDADDAFQMPVPPTDD